MFGWVSWHVGNGFLGVEGWFEDGIPIRQTAWDAEGRVTIQVEWTGKGGSSNQRYISRPPWLWGVTDQTEPTIPAWMKDDAQWQAALDAQE